MIARTVRCHTFFAFAGGKFHDRIGSASRLEGPNFLKIFTLKVDATSCNRIDGLRSKDRRAVNERLDTGMRRSDIGEEWKDHGVKINYLYEVPSRNTRRGGQAKYGGNRIEINSASLREIGLRYKSLFPELARIISSLFRRYFQSSLVSRLLFLASCFSKRLAT